MESRDEQRRNNDAHQKAIFIIVRNRLSSSKTLSLGSESQTVTLGLVFMVGVAEIIFLITFQ